MGLRGRFVRQAHIEHLKIAGAINLDGGAGEIKSASGNNGVLVLRKHAFRKVEKHVLHESNFGINN